MSKLLYKRRPTLRPQPAAQVAIRHDQALLVVERSGYQLAPFRVDDRRAAPAEHLLPGWQLDRKSRQLTDPAGAPVALTKGEYAMLLAFLEAPQRPLSREHLLQATRVHEDVFDRSIDVQILRLRRKLERDPSAPRVIQTERGVGYVFAVPVERS